MIQLFRKSLTRIILNGGIIALMVVSLTPFVVSARSLTSTVRFTASYKSGNTGTKYAYYVLDDGSSNYLGSVSSSSNGDFTFTVTYTNKIRVYVDISDDAIYHENMYINDNLVATGDVGNGGLIYIKYDTSPPSGKITSPISGATITSCPLSIYTKISDDYSGVAWVTYNVNYDGAWHQIASDDSSSGVQGWSTVWDCGQVNDQDIKISITAQDNVGNLGPNLGGTVIVHLQKGATSTPTEVEIYPTAPGLITETLAVNRSAAVTATAVAASATPLNITATSIPTDTTVPSIVAATPTPFAQAATSAVPTATPGTVILNPQTSPQPIRDLILIVIPLAIGYIFTAWVNRF